MGRNEKTLPSVNMWRVGGGKERCLHFPQMTAATKHQNVNGWSWRQCSYLACLKIFVYTRAGQHFNIRRHIGYISIILSSDWYVQKSDITQTEYISQNMENVRVLNFGSKKKTFPSSSFFPCLLRQWKETACLSFNLWKVNWIVNNRQVSHILNW